MLENKLQNSNYCARLVKLPELRKHSNADKLLVCNLYGTVAITGLDARQGQYYIHFPAACKINHDFLSFTNSFQDPELNLDKKSKSFFAPSCRVKPINLRGQKSECYICPAKSVEEWLKYIKRPYIFTEADLEKDFDSFDDLLFVEKYVNKQEQFEAERRNKKQNKKSIKVNRVLESQFRLATDTANFRRNSHKVLPDDVITIGFKIHGSNAVLSRVLVKRKLNLLEKMFRAMYNALD